MGMWQHPNSIYGPRLRDENIALVRALRAAEDERAFDAASRAGVEGLREERTFLCQPVDIRRIEIGVPTGAKLVEAHVIDEHHDDGRAAPMALCWTGLGSRPRYRRPGGRASRTGQRGIGIRPPRGVVAAASNRHS